MQANDVVCVCVAVRSLHQIDRNLGENRTSDGRILEQRAEYAAIGVGAGDLIQNLVRSRWVARKPDVEAGDRARPLVKLAEDCRRRVGVSGERLEEVIGVGLAAINALQSFAPGAGIANRFEGDAQIRRICESVEELGRNRIMGKGSEEEGTVLHATANAAIEPGALSSRIFFQRCIDELAVAGDLGGVQSL